MNQKMLEIARDRAKAIVLQYVGEVKDANWIFSLIPNLNKKELKVVQVFVDLSLMFVRLAEINQHIRRLPHEDVSRVKAESVIETAALMLSKETIFIEQVREACSDVLDAIEMILEIKDE